VLQDVGLGYLRLGQPATTLSGGEAQRLKIAAELAARAAGDVLYMLDEPTTGLHLDDVKKLLQVLHRLVDAGNTVVLVEHHLDVVRAADWVVDLGPEGGDEGGEIVAEGPPETIAQTPGSYTGKFLAEMLPKNGLPRNAVPKNGNSRGGQNP
jgi:excinuclease ABC subunit A